MKKLFGNKYIHIDSKEIFSILLKTIGIIGLLNITFYRSLYALIVLIPIGFMYFHQEKIDLVEKKQMDVALQFKEFLLLSVNGQQGGYSVENAMINAYSDLMKLFGNHSAICLLIENLSYARKNHYSFSEVFKQMGDAVQIEDISEFAEIYALAYNGAGIIDAVMTKTSEIIVEKIDTKNEITMELNERIFEMKIMSIMPFIIILYISITSPGYFNKLYHSYIGVLIMSISLFIYIGAYLWGRKITKINV